MTPVLGSEKVKGLIIFEANVVLTKSDGGPYLF